MTIGPARQQLVEREMAGVHHARILHHVGGFLRHLVAAVVPAALLVAPAGRNRRRALHAPDAFPFGLGDCGVRADADLLRRALDAGRSIPVVLGDLRRLLLRQLRLGRAGGGLCHHRAPATPAHPRPRAAQQPVLFPGPAVLRVHGLPGLHRVRAILSSSGTRTCPTKPSGISSAKTVRGGG